MSSHLSKLLVVLALTAAACTSNTAPETTTTSTTIPPTTTTTTTVPPTTSTTTTTVAPSTTTTLPPLQVFDTINGLELVEDDPLGVIAIKIDNHPKARPHTGLQYADVVYELLVEAGLTRFIALYENMDLEKVGPVRSLRPTDPEIVNPIDVPLQVSGGSNWVLKKVRASGTKLLTDNGNGTYRDNARTAPNNLYADTSILRARIADIGWGLAEPGNLFAYGEPEPTADVETSVVVTFSPQPPSVWSWSAEAEKWEHSYGDAPHMSYDQEGIEQRVTADTLVMIIARRYTSRPPKPSDGKAVPAMDLLGSGEAIVLGAGGQMQTGTWLREARDDIITLENEAGDPIIIEPGKIWVSIVPTSGSVVFESFGSG